MARTLRHIILILAGILPITALFAQQPEQTGHLQQSEETEEVEVSEETEQSIETGQPEEAEISEETEQSEDISFSNPAALLPKPKSNPVDYDREAPEKPVLHYYDKHGEPLETPVRFLAVLDTVTQVKPGPVYPLFNGVSVSANFFDGVMMLIGQQRASFDVAVDCSLHNWFFPVLEAGIGFANARPDDGRCHYKSGVAPYLRIGLNYNFLYKSNPAYQFYFGLRAGWTTFRYNIYDILPGSEYHIADGPTNVGGLSSTAFCGQVLAGLKVHLWHGFFMGWSARLNFDLHQTYSNDLYPAWFTPGRGTSGIISATFSLGWTFGDLTPRNENPLQKQ